MRSSWFWLPYSLWLEPHMQLMQSLLHSFLVCGASSHLQYSRQGTRRASHFLNRLHPHMPAHPSWVAMLISSEGFPDYCSTVLSTLQLMSRLTLDACGHSVVSWLLVLVALFPKPGQMRNSNSLNNGLSSFSAQIFFNCLFYCWQCVKVKGREDIERDHTLGEAVRKIW
jgi:hypothetical protein